LLDEWRITRISNGNGKDLAQYLSFEDVHFLRTLISTEISKARIKQPEVVTDQILFLTIGAIQIESQSKSIEAWQLATKTIRSFSNPRNPEAFFSYSFATLALMICIGMGFYSHTNIHTIDQSPTGIFYEDNEISSTDPVTISMLTRAYSKMKAGTCQSPHADSLPPEQQHAFLKFVTNGVVDVHHVENLRLALDYVNCLYPQEFLHPTPSHGNTL
jgi:hypothetical protein